MIYKKNKLFIDQLNIENIARKYKTPIYCYSLKKIKENIQNFKNHFKKFNPLVCYAVKANSNLGILREIKKNNFGADVVSGGELMKALKAGINPKKIVFSGVGKTSEEIEYAINKNILLINTEKEAVEYIYRQLRNAEPPDEETARGVIDKLFFSDQRYNLGEVGRYRMNKKLNLDVDMEERTLTRLDITTIIKYLIELINSKAEIDDIDH